MLVVIDQTQQLKYHWINYYLICTINKFEWIEFSTILKLILLCSCWIPSSASIFIFFSLFNGVYYLFYFVIYVAFVSNFNFFLHLNKSLSFIENCFRNMHSIKNYIFDFDIYSWFHRMKIKIANLPRWRWLVFKIENQRREMYFYLICKIQ